MKAMMVCGAKCVQLF